MNGHTPTYEITQKLGNHSSSFMYPLSSGIMIIGLLLIVVYITEMRFIRKKSHRRLPDFILNLFDIGYASTKSQANIIKIIRSMVYQSMFLIAIGSLMLYAAISYDQDYEKQLLHYISEYQHKNYEVVEGTIWVTPADNGAYDMVDIGTERFIIGGSSPIVSYQLQAAKGGILRNGAHARIYYLDNVILRIDT